MTVSRWIPAAAIAATLALTMSACSGTSSASDGGDKSGVTLNIGQLGASKVTEALLKASGEDKGMGYSINWSLFEAGPAFIEAVPSGSVDAAMMADTPMIFAQAGKTAIKIVAAANTTASDTSQVEIVVPKGSDITSVADLKGKKVALTQNTIMEYTTLKVLEKAGLSYKDITVSNLNPADAATAFTGGDVDAAAILDPQLSQLIAGGAKVIANGSGLVADKTITVATDAALKDSTKSKEIGDYIVRVQKAYDWAASHKDAWAADYATVTGLDAATAKAVVDRQDYELEPISDDTIAGQQDQADAFTKLGLLQTKLDVKSEFDTRYNAKVSAAVAG